MRIKLKLTSMRSSSRFLRRDQIVFTRCLIGHTNLTHVHYMKKEARPNCNHCQTFLTMFYVLVSCRHLANIHAHHYTARCLKEVFYKVKPKAIISSLQECYIYDKI